MADDQGTKKPTDKPAEEPEGQEEARYVIVGAVKRVMTRGVEMAVIERELPNEDERKKTVAPNMRIESRVLERGHGRPVRKKGKTMSDLYPR